MRLAVHGREVEVPDVTKMKLPEAVAKLHAANLAVRDTMEQAMTDGFDFVAMGRALIFDPQMINRVRTDANYRNGCTHCNICTALIYDPNGVHCVLTGR